MPEIHKWFPKVIFVDDNLLLDHLIEFEHEIKQVIGLTGSERNATLAVDSTHKTNDKLHTNPVFAPLVDQILLNAKMFLIETGHHDLVDHIKIGNMWANISGANDFIFPHVHANSVLSGAFYIKQYPDSTIMFYNDITSVMPEPVIRNDLNYDYCEYECKPGRMMLWKSNFLHGTKKQTEGEKIVISFNIFVARSE